MSSGFSYPQPIFQSPIHNPAFYLTLDASGYLTFDYAQTLYLSKTDYRLTYLTGITQGIATPGVALVPGTGGNISGIGALSCSSLTLSAGGTGLNSPSLKFSGTTFNQNYYINITEGAAGISQAVVLNSTKDFNGIRNLTCSGTISGSTAMATPTLTCDTISKSGTQTMNATTLNLNPTTIQLRGVAITASASEINALAGVTAGSATNSKALVLGSTGSISGIKTLSAATVSTTGDITCGGAINGFLAYNN
ncbi:unnamed protein product [Phytophthora lilii]|uniref:Unnamed protein product n=1 Tax=Phytophthora lilii TaxID=2077276 RepID=A0A9W6XA39_9STRA|nr:unnamed protein product [Phytophthora lilii]